MGCYGGKQDNITDVDAVRVRYVRIDLEDGLKINLVEDTINCLDKTAQGFMSLDFQWPQDTRKFVCF